MPANSCDVELPRAAIICALSPHRHTPLVTHQSSVRAGSSLTWKIAPVIIWVGFSVDSRRRPRCCSDNATQAGIRETPSQTTTQEERSCARWLIRSHQRAAEFQANQKLGFPCRAAADGRGPHQLELLALKGNHRSYYDSCRTQNGRSGVA
jgi:hypothetical protein